MSNKILTALDIDDNNKTIELELDELVKRFNTTRFTKILRDIRNERKVLPENEGIEPKTLVSPEESAEIRADIYSDTITKNYREEQRQLLLSRKDNHYVLRQTMNGLNDLNEFSAEIERLKIQTIDNFKTFQDLLIMCGANQEKFIKIKEIRKNNIEEYLQLYSNKVLQTRYSMDEIIKNMRELYSIDKDFDDIELFEKYNMQSNIDFSNILADVYMSDYINNPNNDNNIINNTLNNDNVFANLIRSRIVSNKQLGMLLLSSYQTKRNSFISNNSVTCLSTTYTTTFNNKLVYNTRTFGELLHEITNPKLSYISKESRMQIYSTYDGTRPLKEEYYKWNGMQVFDLDLGDWIKNEDGNIDKLKNLLFDKLNRFTWFLWICKSASGNGIHIYTKVAPPHHVYTDIEDNEYISRYWFSVNYAHKSSVIYDVLLSINQEYNIFANDDFIEGCELKFLDNVVSRITAGIRLTYDSRPLVNPNFLDLHVGIAITETQSGFYDSSTIDQTLLRKTKRQTKLLNLINNDLKVDNISKYLEEKNGPTIDYTAMMSLNLDEDKITEIPKSEINYVMRYNVCNTLAAVYGKEGISIAHKILQSHACGNKDEINSFYSCAMSNKKEPSKYGLELLKKHGAIKNIAPEFTEKIQDKFKTDVKSSILNSLNNVIIEPDVHLNPGEFISDYSDYILNRITNDKINLLFSPPNTGKTHFILKLAKEGKRVLLVLPFVSVIKNKVETEESVMEHFDAYYGDADIHKLEHGRNAVTTFDKFAKSNFEKLSKMFDYIFIDESHLLFTSSYRIHATSMAVKKIRELYFISKNDVFSAKLILTTGTETGEVYFFEDDAEIIRIQKKSFEKRMEFIICDDGLDAITRLAYNAAGLLNDNYRLLIPTNKGEVYTEKMMGMIEHLLDRPVKYGYYKRSNMHQKVCEMIDRDNTVGDLEIVFCSNYLSVGVDINDPHKFASLYFGNFSGYEIEQFNARIRKSGMRSTFCLQTETTTGSINNVLVEEPDLVLRLTQDDVDNFLDDKQIAKAKQEFVAQYDPILRKIVTPGFSYLNQQIIFSKEEYELCMFETKYAECMEHPIKVARELSKYGYTISVNDDFDGLPIAEQEQLKTIGAAAAKEEKVRKHALIIGTMLELVEQSELTSVGGIVNAEVLPWIAKNHGIIMEDRELEQFVRIDMDFTAVPTQVLVKSMEAYDKVFRHVLYLIKKYSITRCIDLINSYVSDDGIFKMTQFTRAINLLRIVERSDANELSEPIVQTLDNIYKFCDQFKIGAKPISQNTYLATIEAWTNSYIDMLGIRINTKYGYEKIRDSIVELLHDVAEKRTSKNGITFSYNTTPEEDSKIYQNRRSVDLLVEKMFLITKDSINSAKVRVRDKHIILEKQEF